MARRSEWLKGSSVGVVYLVGAGPGARGLVTLRGAALLAAAGHVLHEPGVTADVLGLAGESASCESAASAAEGARRAAQLAQGAERVILLLAGDGVTSPGAGEAMALLEQLGSEWEVVPGVGAEAAAMGYAGLTGSGARGALRPDTNPSGQAFLTVWRALERTRAAAELQAAGLSADVPAVAVVAPGRAAQKVVVGTVAELLPLVLADAAAPGGVLLAGEAAGERIPWFERRPLFGRRVVVTRPRAQSSELVSWLEGQGAEAVEFPAIRVVPAPDPAPLARAAAEVRSYDWLVFTSVNGVERFWAALREAGLDARALGGATVAAIGPATAAALSTRGVTADLVPARYVAESVLEAMAATGAVQGRRVLLARAAGAREILPTRLRELGALVTEVEAYRSVAESGPAEALRQRLRAGEVDAITFTSSSTVQNFVAAVGTELGGAVVACIGPVTAATARELGLAVTLVAAEHTVPGLQAVLRDHFAQYR